MTQPLPFLEFAIVVQHKIQLMLAGKSMSRGVAPTCIILVCRCILSVNSLDKFWNAVNSAWSSLTDGKVTDMNKEFIAFCDGEVEVGLLRLACSGDPTVGKIATNFGLIMRTGI